MKIDKLIRDGWQTIPVSQLVEGDIVRFGDNPGPRKIAAPPERMEDGRFSISVKPVIPENAPIIVDFASDAVAEAMDCTCGSLTDFGDGTGILADFAATGNLYSPRLPHEELKAFCEEHIERYRAFFDANRDAVEDGNPPPMEPWWGESP